jgi:retinol dehydrogenase-12
LSAGHSLASSTVIITGASSGIGRSAARILASQGARMVLVGRSRERHRAVQAELDSQGASHRFVETDLGSLSSVAAAARSIGTHVNDAKQSVILINNAVTAGRRGVTADGFELAFGVNYVSHFLLTALLLQTSLAITTVINVSSNAHYSVPKLDPAMARGKTRTLTGWKEYSHSKAAMAALAVELAERNQGLKSLAVHPGLVATDLWRRIPLPVRALLTRRMLPPVVGALPLVRAATDLSLPSGGYLAPEGLRTPGAAVSDAAGRSFMWESSRRWVEPYL